MSGSTTNIMTNQIQAYLQDVTQIYQKGNATEHTYRPALKRLLESFGNDILAVNEPKQIACGAPDFWIGQGALEVGHLEAKDIGISLKSLEKKNQMQRYFNALGNLILTDHLEFRWYVGGRELSFDDLFHYQNIISILGETIEIMSDIDQIITKHGGFPFP